MSGEKGRDERQGKYRSGIDKTQKLIDVAMGVMEGEDLRSAP